MFVVVLRFLALEAREFVDYQSDKMKTLEFNSQTLNELLRRSAGEALDTLGRAMYTAYRSVVSKHIATWNTMDANTRGNIGTVVEMIERMQYGEFGIYSEFKNLAIAQYVSS